MCHQNEDDFVNNKDTRLMGVIFPLTMFKCILYSQDQIRAGDYRIVFQVLDDDLLIMISKIGNRKIIYRRMTDIP
jgi:hypothetical protein